MAAAEKKRKKGANPQRFCLPERMGSVAKKGSLQVPGEGREVGEPWRPLKCSNQISKKEGGKEDQAKETPRWKTKPDLTTNLTPVPPVHGERKIRSKAKPQTRGVAWAGKNSSTLKHEVIRLFRHRSSKSAGKKEKNLSRSGKILV